MFTIRKVTSEADYESALSVRRAVFVAEQGVPVEAEVDEHEKVAHHFVAFDPNGAACGAARWRETSDGIKLERFAVLANYRRQSLGGKLLQAVLADVDRISPNQRRYLYAQIDVVAFYAKFGFVPYGEAFTECDIVHQAMDFTPSTSIA